MRVTTEGAGETGEVEIESGGSASPDTVTCPMGAAAAPVTGGEATSSGTQPRSTSTARPSSSTSGVRMWLPAIP